jgi:hypothetical protein
MSRYTYLMQPTIINTPKSWDNTAILPILYKCTHVEELLLLLNSQSRRKTRLRRIKNRHTSPFNRSLDVQRDKPREESRMINPTSHVPETRFYTNKSAKSKTERDFST